MKKFALILFAILFIFALAACTENKAEPAPQENPVIDTDIIPPSVTEPAEPDPPGDFSSITVLYNNIDWWYEMDGTVKVQSVDDLNDFYEMLKSNSSNDINDDLAWRFTDGQYNESYFNDFFLLMITTSEMSGSFQHELVSIDESANVLNIQINRIIPEVYTDDMAGRLIIIELSENYSAHEIDVIFTDVHM